MNRCSIAVVQTGFLLVALWANAVVKEGVIRIKVLDSETRSVTFDDSGVPKNCDAVNFDAYCHNSKTVQVINTLLVQEGDQPPFRVSCSSDAKWSRCMPLQRGESFDARREKHGLVLYFADDNGKVRKQLYTFVDGSGDSAPATTTAATPAPPPHAVPVIEDPSRGRLPSPVTPAAIGGTAQEPVKCSFSSTPAGAEVTVDGKYVGSTPSVLRLNLGDHAVEISLTGFATWKRSLTVSAGSQLTVNAVLEKAQ
jgi:PEGA domain